MVHELETIILRVFIQQFEQCRQRHALSLLRLPMGE